MKTRKRTHPALVDLDTVSDRVDIETLQQVLEIYGLNEKVWPTSSFLMNKIAHVASCD